MLVFRLSELDQEKFRRYQFRTTRYLHHEERPLVRNFEMTCYYVAPILPAQLPAQFRAEQAVEAG